MGINITGQSEKLRVFGLTIKLDHIFLLFLLLAIYIRAGPALSHDYLDDESREILVANFLSSRPFDIINIPYTMHPPLFMYLISFFSLVLGIEEFSVRLVPLFLGTLLLVIIYLLGSKVFSKKTALLASMFLSTSFLPTLLSTQITTDIAIAVVFSLALLSFYLGFELNKHIEIFGKKISYTILFGIFLGLAFLTKETSYLIPVILVVYLLLTRKLNFSWLKKKELWVAALLAVLLFLPWAYRNVVVSGDPVELKKWVAENTNLHSTRNTDVWFYFNVLRYYYYLDYGGMALLIVSIVYLWVNMHKNGKLLLSWIFVPFLFLSWYGQKDMRFLIILFPAFYLSISQLLEYLASQSQTKKDEIFLVIFSIVTLIVLLSIPSTEQKVKNMSWQNNLVQEAGYYIKHVTTKNDIIMGGPYLTIQSYSSRKTHWIERNVSNFEKQLKQIRPKFIVYSYWTRYSHEYLFEYLGNKTKLFEPVAIFEDEGLSKGENTFVGVAVYSLKR